MKKLLLLTIFIICISCETQLEVTQETLSSQDYLTFKSEDQLVEYVEQSSQLSLEKLIAQEEAIGFTSFARIAKTVYDSLLNRVFNSEINNRQELFQYIANRSKYIDIVIGDDGETSIVPKHFNDKFSFAINQDKVVTIGDKISKLLNINIVSTKLNRMDDLIHLEEDFVDPQSYQIEKSRYLIPINSEEMVLQSGSDCVSGDEITMWSYNYADTERMRTQYRHNQDGGNRRLTFNLWSQSKSLGVWFNAIRTISGGFYLHAEAKPISGTGSGLTKTYSQHVYPQGLSYIGYGAIMFPFNPSANYVHEYGVYLWGNRPGVDIRFFDCNINQLCSEFLPECIYHSTDPCTFVNCPINQTCIDGTCVSSPGGGIGGNGCSSNNDCDPGYRCTNGECQAI